LTQAGHNLIRWLRVVLMGCVLGLCFAFLGAHFHIFPEFRVDNRLLMPPFKLSGVSLERELTGVIESQLAAFRTNDFPDAFKYADSTVKAQMTVKAFEKMVKTGYPGIARSRTVSYGMILDNGELAVVNAAITGPSGRLQHYQYLLKREKAGWKISGVIRVKLEGLVV
jgi:hypothetical protein